MNLSNAIYLYVCFIRQSFLKIDSPFYRQQFLPVSALGIEDTEINFCWERGWVKKYWKIRKEKEKKKNGGVVTSFELSTML